MGFGSAVKVGHNIYILCHQLAQHNKDLGQLMKPSEDGDPKINQALQYYANHTAQIEVTLSRLVSILYLLTKILRWRSSFSSCCYCYHHTVIV